MKKNCHTFTIQILLLSILYPCFLIAQRTDGEQQMRQKVYNYTTFTSKSSPEIHEELVKLTPKELQSHPEFGILPYDAPCDDCFELLQERKDSERMFVKKGTGGKHFYSQGVYGLYHYEEKGYKISYDPRLKPVSANVYRSSRQEIPSVLDVNGRYSAFERNGELFKFNNQMELILVKNNGTSETLGQANWADHTVGDEGIYIKNAWTGIDITISYQRDRIKLNYVIPQPLNYLQDVNKLIFKDNIELPGGYTLQPEDVDGMTSEGYIGNYIVRDISHQDAFRIDKAFAFDQSGLKENTILLNYTYTGNTLNISVPESWLSSPGTAYPVVIDPLVSNTQFYSAGQMNFRYNGDWCFGPNGSCNYNLAISRPPNSTLTGATFAAQYISSSPCWMEEAAFKIQGPCGISPSGAGIFWTCYPNTSPGTCSASGVDIFAETSNCTTPVCSAILTYTIQNSYCYSATSGCVNSCQVMPNNSWSITLEGRTVETPLPTSVTPNPCEGDVSLTAAPVYGVPGYTYTWSTGANTQSIDVSNAGSYSVVVTDACGVQATQQFTIACPLSIDLTYFNVMKAGESVLVKWETLNEVNNDYFTIERMTDLPDQWEELGKVKGSKHSVEPVTYTFYDNAPYKRGTAYYRLKQTDFNGESFYYETKAIDLSSGDEILIFPQPATNEMIIEWNGFDGEVEWYSLLGEKINLPYEKKGISYLFNTSLLASGIYSVVFLVDGEMVSTHKVVIN